LPPLELPPLDTELPLEILLDGGGEKDLFIEFERVFILLLMILLL
jgi:hypothetical protein